ncbi:AsnC family protein [mine drainage metagenome]|uniref:AsnC family protein n=1 Tax=mine drainage metagenome TaxID=410659 RepID=A0A1J5SPV2_9ZZZZ
MAHAFVLLKIEPKKVTGTAEKLLDIQGVSDVFSISGKHDLLVKIECESVDRIEMVITDMILRTDGVVDSETLFAFRSYDKREGGKAIDVD